ncbi:unnamed protein product [marine sediment metagenome]|uniref:Uncharacterized protein n=1 Tax=marine sediment metagenome TaxID=412755 RepID=X1QR14_9ZZZZ
MVKDQRPDIERLMWPKDASKFQWIDRAKTIMDFATRAGTAYLGYQAFEKAAPGSGLAGAIVSQIALRLADSNNLAGGAAGVSILAGMGIINVYQPGIDLLEAPRTWIENLRSMTSGFMGEYEKAWERGLETWP